MSKKSKKEILECQHLAGNPLLTILQGTVTHLEGMLDLMDEFNVDDTGETLSTTVSEFCDEKRAYIEELAVAKLFEPLILKVQRPLASNDPAPHVLVYNEDRSVMEQMTLADESLYEWFGDDFKMYVRARLWADGTLQLVARIFEEPSW